jgi:predicted transcriptional regulator
MLVDAIMNSKVCKVTRDHTILAAARLMANEQVGSVVVVDERDRPIGLLTDRDITVKGVARGLNMQAPVDEVMSTPVHTVGESTLIFDMLRHMANHKVHRVPVVNRYKKLVGIVSIDDAMLLLTSEMSNIAEVMGHSTRVLD